MTAPLLVLLAAVDTAPSPEETKPGGIALLVLVALGVATVLLWMNMRKQLGKIDFDEKDKIEDGDAPAPEKDHAEGDPGAPENAPEDRGTPKP